MSKIKIKTNAWYKSKKNGNPHFWAFDVLPQLQIHGDYGDRYSIYFGWAFWTIEELKKEFKNERWTKYF